MGMFLLRFWQASFKEIIKTRIDNEKNHSMINAGFDSIMSDAIFSGKEIKSIIDKTNTTVCDQFFDVIHSNCYTGSVCFLAIAIQELHQRYESLNVYQEGSMLDIHPAASQMLYHQMKNL
jgi:hypothetical protein